jgi:hypothetical protein
VAVTAICVALLVGAAVGFGATASAVDEQKKETATAEARAAKLRHQIEDRTAKVTADEAAAKRLEQERLKKEQDDKDAAAKAQAEQQQKAQAAAEQQAKAQQEAAAQAAAQQQAQAAAAAAEAAKHRTVPEGGGVFAIGSDIDPGQWRTDGPNGDNSVGCYYAVLNEPNSGDLGNIEDNNIVQGPTVVKLPAGKYFETQGCKAWTAG